MSILGLLVVVIVLFVVIWAIQQLAGAFNVPPPIKTVIMVLLVVLVVLWIVGQLGLLSAGPVLHLRSEMT
jgi:hypothetical protein